MDTGQYQWQRDRDALRVELRAGGYRPVPWRGVLSLGRAIVSRSSVAELTLLADHRQIQVLDEGSETDLGDEWTDQAMEDHLAVGRDAVAIGTAVNVNVAVSVELLGGPPPDDSIDFDHVAEASFYCSSGHLVVMGCTDYEPEARRFPVAAGWLRLRVSQSTLDRAYQAGIDSDDDPQTMERLRLQVWSAAEAPVMVPNRWRPSA